MIQMKRCSKCKKEKGTQHFCKKTSSKDGLNNYCRPCNAAQAKDWRIKSQNQPCIKCGKGKRISSGAYCSTCHGLQGAKQAYGISIEEVKRLRAIDNCDACGRSTEDVGSKLHIDHCHDKGHVRGVLCQYCNMALGMMRDDPIRIEKLKMYINNANYRYDESNTATDS